MKTTNQMNTGEKRKFRVRYIVVTGMLSAVAIVLMILDFSVPFMPSFIKMDFSEFPALIAAFSMGPVSGVCVCLIKNLVNLTMTETGGVGEFCNFLMGVTFVLPAGLIYCFRKNRTMAVLGSVIGALTMALLSLPINYYITYPIYTKFMPLEVIIGTYQAIFPKVNGLFQCLLIFNVPFTLLKGLLDSLLTFLIYKRISPFIHGKKS